MNHPLINSILNKSPLEKRYAGVLVFTLFLCFSQNVAAQNLNNYQLEAARNNPSLKASYNEYLSALRKSPQIQSLPDPEVSFAYFISPIETRLGPQRARISVTQMFPWFGSLKQKSDGSMYMAQARFEAFQEHRNQLFYKMEVLWADLYEIKEKIRLTNEQLDVINTLVTISLEKYENGLVPQIDVLRAQIEQDELKNSLALLLDNQSLLIQRFNELRNVDHDDFVELPDTLDVGKLASGKENLLIRIKESNPDLKRLEYQERAAENAIEVADDNGKPGFGVGLDYIATGERTDVTSLAGNGRDALIARVTMKIPLFRSRYNAEKEEAGLAFESVQNQTLATQNQLETSLYTALRDLQDAERKFELFDDQQIQRINQAISILTQSYSTDYSQFEEILRLQRKLYSYELERVKSVSASYKAIQYIEYLSGSNNITPEEINY